MGFSRLTFAAYLGLQVMACRPHPRPTLVSIEFDDVHVDQLAAIPLLADNDINATFFVNDVRLQIGKRYFTLADALKIQSLGHEIGGHTRTHARLPSLSREGQIREICGDRDYLREHGFEVDNFAYPAGVHDATTESIVSECGYESARTSGGLCEEPRLLNFCDRSESIPPKDFFATRTHGSIKRERIPNRMRELITETYDHDGGWVQFIFHHICDDCDDYSIRENELRDFLSWLAEERAAGRIRVRTVREVIRGDTD